LIEVLERQSCWEFLIVFGDLLVPDQKSFVGVKLLWANVASKSRKNDEGKQWEGSRMKAIVQTLELTRRWQVEQHDLVHLRLVVAVAAVAASESSAANDSTTDQLRCLGCVHYFKRKAGAMILNVPLVPLVHSLVLDAIPPSLGCADDAALVKVRQAIRVVGFHFDVWYYVTPQPFRQGQAHSDHCAEGFAERLIFCDQIVMAVSACLNRWRNLWLS
jgi:hypothetical protein